MRTRVVSSLVIVSVGLAAIVAGGPVFVLLMAGIGLQGYREFRGLVRRLPGSPEPLGLGYVTIGGLAIAGLFPAEPATLVGGVFFMLLAPLVALVGRDAGASPVVVWSLTVAGSGYLGLPVYGAIALRGMPGAIAAPWLADLATALAPAWAAAPRGLAWTLLTVLAIWVGDSAAYLVGRSRGRRLLVPRLSPKKTVEGAIGGLLGATAVGGLAVSVFGLGVAPVVGGLIGAAIGLAGQIGDLAESMLKRQAGVKDSGTLIPGHGGILDRVDALLVAVPIGWLLATVIDRLRP